jgi:hypothetical protein
MPRVELARVIARVQRHLCAYCHDKSGDSTSGFCDCKYGGEHVGGQSHEDNGCPEMREAFAVINAMTDEEYEKINQRLLRRFQTASKKKGGT